jgi:multimeric flavodoxin WrbA
MKILAVSGSPRPNGNTVAMLKEALSAAAAEGAETELYSVAGKNLKGGEGCWTCLKTGKCRLADDMDTLLHKIIAADGLILGTPIYFWGMTAQLKAIIDRSISLAPKDFHSMPCGVVASCGSLGMVDALKDLSYYIVQRQMLPANQVSAYIMNPEDLQKMPKCLDALHKLGKQITVLAKMNFRYPEEFLRGPGSFGTHTK